MMVRALWLIAILTCLNLSCSFRGPDTPIDFDSTRLWDTLPSLEEMYFLCDRNGQGSFESVRDVIREKGTEDRIHYAMGGGCIYRPIRETWAATQTIEAMDWISSDLKTFKRIPTNQVDYLFEGNYEEGKGSRTGIKKLFGKFVGKQKWVMQWTHYVHEGNIEDPEIILIYYKKIKGTKFINHWEGAIILIKVAPQVTLFFMQNKVRATTTNPKLAAASITEMLEKLPQITPNWDYLLPTDSAAD